MCKMRKHGLELRRVSAVWVGVLQKAWELSEFYVVISHAGPFFDYRQTRISSITLAVRLWSV